jgi:hypothetical protein
MKPEEHDSSGFIALWFLESSRERSVPRLCLFVV